MKYRLISIFNLSNGTIHKVDIEVCLNVGKNRISPFQRKVNVFELYKELNSSYDFLLNALAGTGQVYQPFGFNTGQLNEQLLEDIMKLTQSYIKKGTSLKPFAVVSHEFERYNLGKFESGKIESAELTIETPERWWENIKVNFRYEDCLNLIPATIRTEIPFTDIHNVLKYRDYIEEQKYISNLYGILDNKYSSLSFDIADTISLKQCIKGGWQVFFKKKNSKPAKLKILPNKYGIDWFSTSNINTSSNEEIADQLLNKYLKEDNFYQSLDGNINIFNSNQIKDLPKEVIIESIHPQINLNSLYSPILRLDSKEKNIILQTLINKISVKLMDFQIEGVIWLTEMRKHGSGCLLADDMGLGKTLQTISYLSTRPSDCLFLVVVPKSLIDNWSLEIIKFSPQLKDRVTITSYDHLRLNPQKFANHIYDTLVIDEGQVVKNYHTQRHKAFNVIKRGHTIMLTGTPIENGIHEIWSQFDLLIPGIKNVYDKVCSTSDSLQPERIIEISRILLSPFILRRTKDEVFKQFPQKHINNIYIKLTTKERAIYENIKLIILRALETGVTGRINSLALTGLLRLRQACICPLILPQQFRYYNIKISSKFLTATEIIKNKISQGHKVLVFSQFTSVLEQFQLELNRNFISNYILAGGTTNRIELVTNFNKFDNIKVFLISLNAGGTGLNLTAADIVILLDDWWNPAVEEQAFARSHRIGQEHDVMIYRIICKDTVEEKILELQEKKKNVSDIFNNHNNLTIEDIKNLIS